jgi:hypothetical protein
VGIVLSHVVQSSPLRRTESSLWLPEINQALGSTWVPTKDEMGTLYLFALYFFLFMVSFGVGAGLKTRKKRKL